MIKCLFHKKKLNAIDTVYKKTVYHFQDKLVGLAELANFTVLCKNMSHVKFSRLQNEHGKLYTNTVHS